MEFFTEDLYNTEGVDDALTSIQTYYEGMWLERGIPIKYVGLGEGVDDLEVFDIEQYLYGLFADFFEEEK